MIKDLQEIGFVRAGSWNMSQDNIAADLTAFKNNASIVYSFVSNDSILYIGKTNQTLERRIYGYQNPGPTQRTNIRVNSLIHERLEAKEEIIIFILIDNCKLGYHGIPINLAAGIEDNLISQFKPKWNLR